MIKVYLENGIYAEKIATFQSEIIYYKCLPVLEKIAKENKMFITESVKN